MNLGIPYMGSKRKLAPRILHHITNFHPKITDFYDLCGGGGSVSFSAIRDYKFNVHYNELNSHIFSLVEYLKSHRELEPKFFEWVTRDMFFEQINRTDADWYSGFVMSCWSFGNKQSSYIYGEDIEEMKRLAHQFVVFGCLDSMRELGLDCEWVLKIKDVQHRRIEFCNYVQKINMHRFDIQNLERLVQLERIQKLQLQKLQKLQKLQCTNLSYDKVDITGNNPVIYLDKPYEDTGEYKEGGFDHKHCYEWAMDNPHPVYISEYTCPLQQVVAFSHRSSMSATNNKLKTIERLFWNGKGTIENFRMF